jgi:hypothetical protein
MPKIKAYARWLIIGITLFFVAATVKHHWDQVKQVTLDAHGLLFLGFALGITLLAHLWSAQVWFKFLQGMKLSLNQKWVIRLYLTTNIAKYLPGNIGHFSGRVMALNKVGGSLRVASLAVLLEPVLMAAAALIIVLMSQAIGWIKSDGSQGNLLLQVAGLGVVLLGVHPKVLNPIIHLAGKLKKQPLSNNPIFITQYPLFPLLGECGFVLLRGGGFVLTWLAFAPASPRELLTLLSAFSLAWLLGLVVPGAPGGLGVFEATAIALLKPLALPTGILLTTLALFRVTSIVAEAIAAFVAWRLLPKTEPDPFKKTCLD